MNDYVWKVHACLSDATSVKWVEWITCYVRIFKRDARSRISIMHTDASCYRTKVYVRHIGRLKGLLSHLFTLSILDMLIGPSQIETRSEACNSSLTQYYSTMGLSGWIVGFNIKLMGQLGLVRYCLQIKK